MKISIIGAGNVGGLTAMRLIELNIGDIVLIDAIKGLAEAKAMDLEDSLSMFKYDYALKGTDDIKKIRNSNIIIITAGLTRRPGMSREELLYKNAEILKEICSKIKRLSPKGLVIIVTNPVDILTYLAIKVTGFPPNRIFGIGANLDSARFANLISKELNIPNVSIDALVVGGHGKNMLPLSRFTYIKGVLLSEFLQEDKIEELKQRTIQRGGQIVSLLGIGSAYFAPSAAIANVVKTILKDEKRTLPLSAYLKGEYGYSDICIGLPCRLGKDGIEKIIELELNKQEKDAFLKSVESIDKQKELLNGLL